jgi:hypothetical protein
MRSTLFFIVLTLAVSLLPDNLVYAQPKEEQDGEYHRIEMKHKANYDFYKRVLSFSQLSWASPPFLDRGSEKGSYILSADISPHFNIGGERMPFVFQLTPRYIVRIFRDNEEFNDTSLPVRTPSYMPGGTFFIPLRSPRSTAATYDWYKDKQYLGLAFFHHSNGQDGPEFNEDGTINVHNGNFSTNFLEFAYNFNKRTKLSGATFGGSCNGDEDCAANEMPKGYRDVYGKLGLEQHFNTTDAIKDLYGTTRINFNLGYIKTYNARLIIYRNAKGKTKSGSKIATDSTQNIDLVQQMVNKEEKLKSCQVVGKCYHKEYVRFLMNTSFIVNELAENSGIKNRINADIGMYMRISGNTTAWFLMAGYYGSDPYNIYFQKSYFFIRTGVALGFFNYTNKFQYDK